MPALFSSAFWWWLPRRPDASQSPPQWTPNSALPHLRRFSLPAAASVPTSPVMTPQNIPGDAQVIPEVAFEVIDGAEDDDEAPEPHTVDDATGTAGAASGTKGGDTESATANDSTNDAANDIANDVTQATLSMHSSGLIASLLAAALNRRRGSSSSSLSWLEDTCIYDEAEVRSALPSAAPAYPSAASSAGVDGFLFVLAEIGAVSVVDLEKKLGSHASLEAGIIAGAANIDSGRPRLFGQNAGLARDYALPRLTSISTALAVADESSRHLTAKAQSSLPHPPFLCLQVAPQSAVSASAVAAIPSSEASHSAIQATWTLFAAMSDAQRNQMLKGLLSKCSSKQVEFICTNLNLKLSEPLLPGQPHTLFATDAVGKFSPQTRMPLNRKAPGRIASTHKPDLEEQMRVE
ncbi:hypothetical protein HDU84_006524, partial [Entophlyctis sp. JEL0112]